MMPRKTAQEALEAAAALKINMDFAARSRGRVRAIMDGGAPAIRALLGDVLDDEGVPVEDLPWANWLATALTKLAYKIGQYPKIRTDTAGDSDDEAPRERAEKKRKAVSGYDGMHLDRMELQLPQMGRWLPGYGYSVHTIGGQLSTEGIPYPKAALRDPFDTYVGEWGINQQPEEIAIYQLLPIAKAKELYPVLESEFDDLKASHLQRVAGGNGAVLLGSSGSSWANQRGRGVQVVEYRDADGTHLLLPALHKRVDFIPNPLDSGPAFVVGKRFAFNNLIGQYDHTFGLMAAGAKINALAIIAMEDATLAPTDIAGTVVGDKRYRFGRNEINMLTPGTNVTRNIPNLPYQMFELITRIEREFRNTASYPVQDDANSPLNFATGAGLAELLSTVSLEVREYYKVIRYALQDVDAKRLEWDEKLSPNRRKPIGGKMSTIPQVETYKPATDFRGDWETRRSHGLMAGWDDPAKIVGGLQMFEAELLDALTFQENVEGFEDIDKMNERIQDKKARDALYEGLVAAAQQGDLRAIDALIEMLPEGELKEVLKKFYTPGDPQLSPDEEAFLQNGGVQGDPMAQLFAGGDPAATTVLSRLTQGGAAQGGVQTVGEL